MLVFWCCGQRCSWGQMEVKSDWRHRLCPSCWSKQVLEGSAKRDSSLGLWADWFLTWKHFQLSVLYKLMLVSLDLKFSDWWDVKAGLMNQKNAQPFKIWPVQTRCWDTAYWWRVWMCTLKGKDWKPMKKEDETEECFPVSVYHLETIRNVALPWDSSVRHTAYTPWVSEWARTTMIRPMITPVLAPDDEDDDGVIDRRGVKDVEVRGWKTEGGIMETLRDRRRKYVINKASSTGSNKRGDEGFGGRDGK